MLARWFATVVRVSVLILLYLVIHCALTQGHNGPPFKGHQSTCHGLSCMLGHLIIKKKKNNYIRFPKVSKKFSGSTSK